MGLTRKEKLDILHPQFIEDMKAADIPEHLLTKDYNGEYNHPQIRSMFAGYIMRVARENKLNG